MITKETFVAQARTYIDVPFMHQGRSRNGVDCIGLISCTVYDLGMADIREANYSTQPDAGMFRTRIRQYLTPVAFKNLRIADVLTMRFLVEQHVAVVTVLEPLTIIHSYLSIGRVVEQAMSKEWMNRICGCYRIPGVEV